MKSNVEPSAQARGVAACKAVADLTAVAGKRMGRHSPRMTSRRRGSMLGIDRKDAEVRVSGKIAAGLVTGLCTAAEQRGGLSMDELLDAALLDREDLADPMSLVPAEALVDLMRFLLKRTGDPGIGLRLAGPVDLRRQGFWGYALLSSLTLRQRFELHVRYQPLRSPWSFSFWEEAGKGIFEFVVHDLPGDVLPALLDFSVAGSLHQLRRHFHPRRPSIELWLAYAEQPHHESLRALADGPIIFRAPCNRLELPAADLDTRLGGDPHLGKLTEAQLDAQLARAETANTDRGLIEQVRDRVTARLHRDASLSSIADDMRTSARALRRRLESAGASFQDLLDDVRRVRAIDYLVSTDEAIDRIAEMVGYADPSNFRRAFRRWTGMGPSAFRARQRSSLGGAVAANDRPAVRKASP